MGLGRKGKTEDNGLVKDADVGDVSSDAWQRNGENGTRKSKETPNDDYFNPDVIDEIWEKEHLKYGWGRFKPQYVFLKSYFAH